MLRWVDTILKPYVQTAPVGIQPILFLDLYCCHMMTSVVSAIQNLGVHVEHIPGGCTGLCQPVDVGICKPLKNWITKLWEDWMVQQLALQAEEGGNDKMEPPKQIIVARWVTLALFDLPVELLQNSWLHEPYSYFAANGMDNNGGFMNNNNNINIEVHDITQRLAERVTI